MAGRVLIGIALIVFAVIGGMAGLVTWALFQQRIQEARPLDPGCEVVLCSSGDVGWWPLVGAGVGAAIGIVLPLRAERRTGRALGLRSGSHHDGVEVR